MRGKKILKSKGGGGEIQKSGSTIDRKLLKAIAGLPGEIQELAFNEKKAAAFGSLGGDK